MDRERCTSTQTGVKGRSAASSEQLQPTRCSTEVGHRPAGRRRTQPGWSLFSSGAETADREGNQERVAIWPDPLRLKTRIVSENT